MYLHLQMEVERSNRIERSVQNHKVKLFLVFGACNRLLMQTTQISIQIDFFRVCSVFKNVPHLHVPQLIKVPKS